MKYEFEIKAWLYAHGFKKIKEVDSGEDKPYDAFLAYAKEDRDIMLEVEREVRKQQQTKLLIHDRDFEGGKDIDKNIIEGIRDSKKTVVFLSRNFLKSHWCMFEFKTAYELTIKDEVNRLVIVTVGDLPTEKELRYDIRSHMELKTYLTWESKHFWEQLLFVLPVREDSQDNAEEGSRLELQQFPECDTALMI
ncbi:protein toll-like [Uloborus diversus]|uniref:protein toll-like n=1 Tax=Uloborus diversus TaxID=327109 RepID=UPI002409BAD2|nr:protein toll-like [Uloborus diversus]